jgi:hypothetical protein
MTQAQFDRPYSWCDITIKKDEDWRESVVLQRLNEDGAPVDFDFTNVVSLDLYIRPKYDHSVLIRRVSSILGISGEVVFSGLLPGHIAFVVSRASVIANIPVGIWSHFLVVSYSDNTTEELWRGNFTVLPGRTS